MRNLARHREEEREESLSPFLPETPLQSTLVDDSVFRNLPRLPVSPPADYTRSKQDPFPEAVPGSAVSFRSSQDDLVRQEVARFALRSLDTQIPQAGKEFLLFILGRPLKTGQGFLHDRLKDLGGPR